MQVSAIIPAHDRPESLARAVDSVLAQTFHNYELIVVDDGSQADLQPIANQISDAGHHFVRQPQSGVASARNHGARLAQGAWLAFLDSDDYWSPEKLATQLAFHQSSAGHAFAMSQTAERWIRQGREVTQGKRYRHASGDIFAQCLDVCCLSSSSILLKRTLFEDEGGFDERYPVCEDYDLWLRLTRDQPVAWIDSPMTVKHAGHPDQLSQRFPAMDRFRLHALLDLWCSPATSAQHQTLIIQEILTKSQTLQQGAHKRGLATESLYAACCQWTHAPTKSQAARLMKSLHRNFMT